MVTIKTFFKLAIITILTLNTISCKKPAGPGGNVTIKGKVYAYDFDNTQLYLLSQGYSAGERVYISYGSNLGVDDDVKTGQDGSFEFKFLTKGVYRVFVNSLDTSIKVKGNDTKILVIRDVNISGSKETVTIDDIIINK